MERLQGPINPCFLADHVNEECLEEAESGYDQYSLADSYYRFEDNLYSSRNHKNTLESTLPFLKMLQESPPPYTEEPNLHFLLRLQNQQHKKPWIITPDWTVELESCVTEAHSPMTKKGPSLPATTTREKRKRKRSKPSKNSEDVESQRMTHIAVERNRRKQMNDHISSLRSLMPPSFVQRGDQASIIGGAIDFVKELEQLLQSLQAEKSMRSDGLDSFDGFFTSPQYTTYSSSTQMDVVGGHNGWMADNGSALADIEVTVIQSHANLKILSPRRPGQLVRAIAALEELHLVILHLNITALQSSVLYSLNLKIEDECKLGKADEIATAVHQIFSFINES
ncbi:Transcription factor bHLH67 [Acorus calamus]|uniref:Transcription factor bHLH67 n=1 Tax=Acorus calamus TaxID=4465 RepID=A0AAV9FI54_ACOCL|nr:Transcription factor bHLH67 [Acorus calamus]